MGTIYLAGGCFWGLQKYLDKNPGGYCHIPRSFFSMEDRGGERKEEELRKRIGDLAYEVTQHAATETPYAVRHIAYPQSD